MKYKVDFQCITKYKTDKKNLINLISQDEHQMIEGYCVRFWINLSTLSKLRVVASGVE
jgi:hypothetical protein